MGRKYTSTRNPNRGAKLARLQGNMRQDLQRGAVGWSRQAIAAFNRDNPNDERTRAQKKAEGSKKAREAAKRKRERITAKSAQTAV